MANATPSVNRNERRTGPVLPIEPHEIPSHDEGERELRSQNDGLPTAMKMDWHRIGNWGT